MVVDRPAGHRKDAVHQEVHRIGYPLEAPFIVDVAHLEEHRRHHLPEQPEIGGVAGLLHLLDEHLREQPVQPQHQRIALEVGPDGPISIRPVGIGGQVIVEPAAHVLVPQHGPHAGFGELHVDAVMPQVMQQLRHSSRSPPSP